MPVEQMGDFWRMIHAPIIATIQETIISAILVVASWYGPSFYGHTTACGQILTPETVGVAHKTLPCGTLVTLRHGERTFTAPVIDRGPFVQGREFDLTRPVKDALDCSDLCVVSWEQ